MITSFDVIIMDIASKKPEFNLHEIDASMCVILV